MATTPSHRANPVKPLKTISERARERETFKYEPFLLTEYRINDTGLPLPSSELATSSDGVLTALAQIGTYQTGTERAFISLFDTSYQYIVAEATPLIPLKRKLPSADCPERLLHCGTAIPRQHGKCERVLQLAALDRNHVQRELPVVIVKHDSLDTDRPMEPFFQFDTPSLFYAAVPIRTKEGIDIGVYCVINSTQPDTWDDQCATRLVDMSRAVMEHLDAKRSKHAYRRNERVNRGLGSFIEGKSTLSGWRSGPNEAAFVDGDGSEGILDANQQCLEHQEQQAKDEEPLISRTGLTAPANASSPWSSTLTGRLGEAITKVGADDSSSSRSEHGLGRDEVRSVNGTDAGRLQQDDSGGSNTSRVFSKAANLIRESFEVEACLFFDVTFGSYRTTTVYSPLVERDLDGMSHQSSSPSGSDDQSPMSRADSPDSPSDLLGFSTSHGSSVNGVELNGTEEAITKRLLARLLRRYPDGKIFNFDRVGELQSSDYSEEDSALKALADEPPSTKEDFDNGAAGAAGAADVAQRKKTRSQLSRLKEGSLIHQAFPSARSVAFVPIWDSKRDRWLSGGFIYTHNPARIFNVEGELSVFRAFSKLIATEVHNLENLQADKAKSDALGSLSHELRSPLHGIILGAELLNDTDLSVFQSNATHTIETCCRTLLDTIDHLLDYSKVNSFSVKRQQENSKVPPKLRKRAKSQFGKKMLYANARLDGLVEEVANSIFAGFNFQHMSVRQLSKKRKSAWTDAVAHNQLDYAQAVEQLVLHNAGEGEYKTHFGDISVFLWIDPACDWTFYMQAGAIRRIVMNLFGNSLKYTTKGSISITLRQEKAVTKRKREEQIIKLTVQDTGKGIGEDYLRHKLFTPFAQEDELAPGTGLGLSIVKTIVSQLRGRILVESQAGVGTTITVKLPLEQPPQIPGIFDLSEDDRAFEKQVDDLKGLRVRLVGFESQSNMGALPDRNAVVEDICRRWLQLDVIKDEQVQQITPDIVLWLDDALPNSFEQLAQLARTPNIVVCKDAFVSYQRFIAHESAGQGGIFEFITQPVGPRKLAKSMQLAYERWMGIPKIVPPPRPAGPMRSNSTHSIWLQSETFPQRVPSPASSTMDVEPIEPFAVLGPEAGTQPPAASLLPHEEATLTQVEPEQRLMAHKILLVDDNHINLKILSAYMGKLGRAYEIATNGKEAVDAYTHNPGHFVGVLMDISMPVMDGLEATRHIRAFEHQNRLNAVAIFALTGLATDSAQQEALGSGVDVFLTKPVRLKVLGEILESRNVIQAQETKREEPTHIREGSKNELPLS